MERAQKFYEAMLALKLRRESMGSYTLAVFGDADGSVGGCLLAGAEVPAPAATGTIVYLNASPSIDAALARVEAAGGRITTPKVQLPDGMGFFAHIADPDGNRVGLHAQA